MNTLQKADVVALRQEGYSYRAIADYTGLTYDAVKSYCKRQKLTGVQEHDDLPERSFCRECGKEVPLIRGHAGGSSALMNAGWSGGKHIGTS